MSEADNSKRGSAGTSGTAGENGGRRAEAAMCCGFDVTESTAGCPCKGLFRSHRIAAAVVCGAVVLAVLISQAGGVLGIVAFIRTL